MDAGTKVWWQRKDSRFEHFPVISALLVLGCGACLCFNAHVDALILYIAIKSGKLKLNVFFSGRIQKSLRMMKRT